MLPAVADETMSDKEKLDRQAFLDKLTECWSDCAGVVVVEQNSPVSHSEVDIQLTSTGWVDAVHWSIWEAILATTS